MKANICARCKEEKRWVPKVGLLEVILIYILLPWLIIRWIAVLVLYIQGRVNDFVELLEEPQD